jgi:glycosyltransferase involved in cell wall biosynthesis
MRTSQVAVVIPALNEAGTIRKVVTGALAQVPRVIVIDDGSDDGTADELTGLPVMVLRNRHNLGKGKSLRRGLKQAWQDGAHVVITLDGDGQHEPKEIPSLLDVHRRHPRAIVIGARLHDKHNIPSARYNANRIANFWISWAAGQPIVDSQSGFRLYPLDVIHEVALPRSKTGGFVFESEILIEAGRSGVGVLSVPVAAIYGRHLRRSHFRQVTDVTLIFRMVAWKLLSRGMDVPGLVRSLAAPPVGNDHRCR